MHLIENLFIQSIRTKKRQIKEGGIQTFNDLERDIEEEEADSSVEIRNGVERNAAPGEILQQVEDVVQDLDPVEDESRVDVRGSSGPDATGVGGDEAELPPAIGDGDGERPVVEGEEIAVANEEGEIERDVNGDRGAGVGDSDAVEIESNDLEVGIGGPEEEDGEGEDGDGEEEVGDAPTDAREGGGSVVGREEDVVDGGFVVVVVVVVLGVRV